MFTVKLEVNGQIIKCREAVRQSDRAYGENSYAVYEVTKFSAAARLQDINGGRFFIGYVLHVYEEGPAVLAKKVLDYRPEAALPSRAE